jgi:hypothetical protein
MMKPMESTRDELTSTGCMAVLTHRALGAAAALAFMTAACGGQKSPGGASSRQEALDIVLADVVDVSEHSDIEIFAMAQPLPTGTAIAVEFDEAVEGRVELAVLDESAWLFFADLAPGWKFEHPAQIILVQADDGSVQVFDVGWWPLIDGQERWRTAASREGPGEKVFSKLTTSPPDAAGSARILRADGGLAAAVPSYCQPDDIQKWALTVAAADDLAVDPGSTTELALRLKTHGYQAEALTPSNVPSGVDTVLARLQVIRQKIVATDDGGYCDELFLIWNGHGSKNGWLVVVDDTGQKSWIRGDTLAIEVDKTTERIEGMQVRVAIDSCYSGNHIGRFATRMPLDPGASEVRHVHIMTATTAIEQSSGSPVPGTTFTEDLYDCIEELGGVDFTGMFDCATDRAWTQTPQQQSWWNDGA